MRAAMSALGMAAGLALLYAIIVPPLQAPDEPEHLLSFSDLTGRTDMPAREAAWAQRVHFDRIASRTGERFTPNDREQPWYRPWSTTDVFAEDVFHRSATATRFWQALSHVVPRDPARVLLYIRTADALVFGLAMAAGAAVLATARAPVPAAIALLLLGVPALPFFAMQMSEITWSIVAVILIGCSATALLITADSDAAGLLIGVATALLAAGTRAAWPDLAVVPSVLAARIVRRPFRARASLRFWVAVALPTVVLFATGLLYVAEPSDNQWHLPGIGLRIHGATVATAVVIAAGLGYAAERVWVKTGSPTALAPFRYVAAATAVWLAAVLLWSVFDQLPAMPTLELTTLPMGLATYVRRVLMCILTTPRARGADFFAWTTFLSGFGWIDTFLPQRLLSGLTVCGAFAAMWLLGRLSREQDGVRSAVATFVLAGVVLAIVASAVGTYGLNRALHGRYLLGP